MMVVWTYKVATVDQAEALQLSRQIIYARALNSGATVEAVTSKSAEP